MAKVAIILALLLTGCDPAQFFTERDECRKRAPTPYEYHRC